MSESAHHVARLLFRGSGEGSDKNSTLAKLTRDVEAFLQHAVDVPPVMMEASHEGDSTGEEEVQLNVVAGVLEPREVPSDVVSVDGVVLPTAENQMVLDQQRVQEAQAMLNLVAALSASDAPVEAGSLGLCCEDEVGDGSRGDDDDDDDDDDESVAVFDADELDNDTSSSDDGGNVCQRLLHHSSRIVELN